MDQQIIATWAQVGVGVGQLILIGCGLWLMGQSGKRRDRALDQQGEALGKMGQGLERQGEVLAELLRRATA